MGKKRRVLTLDDHLCFALYGASLALGRAYKPLLDEWGITYPQYLVLSVLWEEDRLTSGTVAARLSLEPSTVTPLVGRLIAGGFVTRERSETDGRQVVVALTGRGTALAAERACLADTLLKSSGMSAKTLRRLNEEVRELRDELTKSVRRRLRNAAGSAP